MYAKDICKLNLNGKITLTRSVREIELNQDLH